MDRDFIWECDYGEREQLISVVGTLLDQQPSEELQMVHIFVNNNPYQLELFVVFSYDDPKEEQIKKMKQKMRNIGVIYRPDITHEELFGQPSKRFNHTTFFNSSDLEMRLDSLFMFEAKREIMKKISMKPLGKKNSVFISHTSINKPKIEKFIPYLTGAQIPIWYDKINIDFGDSIVKKIQEGIEDSAAVIFWITPEFLKSNWCDMEVETFLTKLASENSLKLYPLIRKDVDKSNVPLFLKNKKYFEFNKETPATGIAEKIVPSIKSYFQENKR